MLGLSLRFDDLRIWKKREKIYFLNQKPLYSSYDAYLFARYAKLHQEGNYLAGEVDPLRFVPDNVLSEHKLRFPKPIPQLSWLVAKVSALFGATIEDTALYLVPILACLFVFPLYLFLWKLGYPAAGFLGALTGVSSLIYLVRSSIMRLDTDALNLFYPFLISFCLLGYFRLRRPYNLLSVIVAAALSNLFYLWYSAANPVILAILGCFLLAIFFERKWRPGKEDILAFFLFLLPNIWYLWRTPLTIYYYFHNLIFGKPSLELFKGYPNILQSISELNKAKTLEQVSSFVLPQKQLFTLGLLGFLAFLVKEVRQGILILPLFLTGLLVFKAGNRFGMYLAPFVGVGLGFLIHFLWQEIVKRISVLKEELFLQKVVPVFLGVLLGALIFFINKPARSYVASPKILTPIAANLAKLSKLTPPEAWIWTWWDYGYAIAYLGKRAVFIDGGSQTTPKTYYVALSFTSPSPEEAYHVISFLTEKGLTGVEEKLKEGLPPSRLTELIKKGVYVSQPKHPVYWLFTGDLITKFAWISYFGSWDFERQKSEFGFLMMPKACRQKGEVVTCSNAKIDLKKGEVLVQRGNKLLKMLIKKLIVRKGRLLQEKPYRQTGVILESVPSSYGRFLFLADEKVYRSNFNQMYILRRFDSRYFRLVYDDFPYAVLYEVKTKL